MIKHIRQLAEEDHVKKPTKEEQIEIIEQLAREIDTEDYTAQLWLARLYKAFIPAAPRKPRSLFEWVARAAATKRSKLKSYQRAMQYVYVGEDGLIAATDAHRLHTAHSTSLEPGLYHPRTGKKVYDLDETYTFPPVARLLEKFASGGTVVDFAEDAETTTAKDGLLHVYNLNGTLYNRAYVDAAISLGDATVTQYKKENGPLKIETGDKLALVMPFM